MEDNFSMDLGVGHGFRMIQTHYVYCALYFYHYYISSTSDHQALDLRGWGHLYYLIPWYIFVPPALCYFFPLPLCLLLSIFFYYSISSFYWPGSYTVFKLFLYCFSSVAQSCPTLCDPMNCSTPGLPVRHHLPEFTQTHVHWVSDAIQPSHPLSSPSPPALNPSQHQGLFQWVNSSHEVAKVLEFQL